MTDKALEFDSYESAEKEIKQKFLRIASCLRLEDVILDCKLELSPWFDRKGDIEGCTYLGKYKFRGETFEDEDGEEVIDQTYKTVFTYALKREEETNKTINKVIKKERWVLEKV